MSSPRKRRKRKEVGAGTETGAERGKGAEVGRGGAEAMMTGGGGAEWSRPAGWRTEWWTRTRWSSSEFTAEKFRILQTLAALSSCWGSGGRWRGWSTSASSG